MGDPRVHRGLAYQFLKRHKIKTFCSIPIILSGKAHGALNLYRDVAITFPQGLTDRAVQFASLIAGLYDSVWDRVSFNLIASVRDFIQDVAIARTAGQPRVVMDKLCEQISDAFDSLETSVFLEHRLERPGVFDLAGTTCQAYVYKDSYRKADGVLTG